MHAATGKTLVQADRIDAGRAAALHATLGREGPPPGDGDALPAFWHQIYFWNLQPPSALGEDGHAAVGTGLIPDLGLPQRMWAGGRLRFHARLRIGAMAERISTVEAVSEKTGRSGRLGFVVLRHEIRQAGKPVLTEWQDLVYRQPPADRAPVASPVARADEVLSVQRRFDATMLFRYSALTFNGHRIHYDIDYCRRVEGYGGLVVHGPLLAQELMQMAESRTGPLREFTFRATAPLIHHETATLCAGADGELWVRAPDGRQCMTARAGFR